MSPARLGLGEWFVITRPAAGLLLCALAGGPALTQSVDLEAGFGLGHVTGGDPAERQDLYGYVEADLGGVYLSVAADHYARAEADTLDLTLGTAGIMAGGTEYDLSYTRTAYPADGGDCCGSLSLALARDLGRDLIGAVTLDYDPGTHLGEAHLELDYGANEKLHLFGSLGLVQQEGARDAGEWQVGLSHALGRRGSLSLQYHDSSSESGYIGLDLSWAGAWSVAW